MAEQFLKIINQVNHTEIGKNKLKNVSKNIKQDQIKKRKINVNNRKVIFICYIIFFLNKFIIIKILCKINNSILLNSLHFHDSKITLIIKGIGESIIFGNETNQNFQSINFLKEVYINGNIQKKIEYKYNFNQTYNYVELIWDDNLNNCAYMFSKCSNIIDINLTNFDTSQVTTMEYMFYSCSSLTSLDLSNFKTSSSTSVEHIFEGCKNLEFINLSNFGEGGMGLFQGMFNDVPANVIICTNGNIHQYILGEIKTIACYSSYCEDDWKSKQKKLINNNNQCIESCDDNQSYQYEYNGKCYENCPQGTLHDENNMNINKCKCELKECSICSNFDIEPGFCVECNIGYYPMENDPFNIGKYIKCYTELDGYFLEDNMYKQCYYTCKTCNKAGDDKIHNCIECNSNYTMEINYINYINCYENCSYYYYFDDEGNYYCTLNSTCPKDYPKLNKDKKECIKNNINNIIEEPLINGISENNLNTKEKEIEYYDNLLKIIEEGFTENYDTSTIDKGQDEVIETDKMTVTFTTSENQKSNINNNVTTIDLGECETILRNEYNLSSNETLYMKKIDIVQEGMKTSKVEYDVYCKLFGKNLIKLNLTVCNNSKISIYLPIEITGNLDKYNSSSGYYNDICYVTTSEDGTDISLKDRQKNFIAEDKIVCQENCEFINYNSEKLRAECSCNVKEASSSFGDMNIDKAKLLDNFINIKNIVNFNFLVCYKNLFCKIGIENNIGSYIILSIIFFHIITLILFYAKQFQSLKKKINNISNFIFEKVNKGSNLTTNSNTKKILTSNIKYNLKRKKKSNTKKTINLPKIKKENKIMKFKDEEINTLPYNLALIYDKRNYCEYYASLLKTQHNLICAFFNNDDYNSQIIKIDLFFIGFAIEYTVNGLFFNDDTMHKIYESKGEFDFEHQIPIIIYSTLISMIFNSPLNYLALSNESVLNFKQIRIKNNIQ